MSPCFQMLQAHPVMFRGSGRSIRLLLTSTSKRFHHSVLRVNVNSVCQTKAHYRGYIMWLSETFNLLSKRLLQFSSTGKEQIHDSWPWVIYLAPTRYYVVVTQYIFFPPNVTRGLCNLNIHTIRCYYQFSLLHLAAVCSPGIFLV